MLLWTGVERRRLALYGAVQGVGFRPFVYRLANDLGLGGFVRNSSAGALVEVEGLPSTLDRFLQRLHSEKPVACWIASCEVSVLVPSGAGTFVIQDSDAAPAKTAFVLPDLATCQECLNEFSDPAERRYQYAFTNCTHCGPRYSIIQAIPYDRPNTTMAEFSLCEDCAAEYRNPLDRRFHAQPIACPKCGPALTMGIDEAAGWLRRGEIVALKGIGGFQLLCDARNDEAVQKMRVRKHREQKPFAVLFPNLDGVREHAIVSPSESAVLYSSQSPIVLLKRSPGFGLAASVCGESPYVGAMLPYSPLHHLLMRACGFPVVATSGNRTDEPIAIDNKEAQQRLGTIADRFMMHNRAIARPCDDSVVRLAGNRETVLRRARGYAPLPVLVPHDLPKVLAVGAHLKNSIAIAMGRQVYLSQHIGDLETAEAFHQFKRTIDDLCRLYEFEPQSIACDLHPDYLSTQHAEALGLPLVRVQHHVAHVAACAAENDVRDPYLGIAWDGTGYGTDGAIWGSEFFLVRDGLYQRVAHLRPFRLPGGDAAARDCRRSALGLLWQAGMPLELSGVEKLTPLVTMLERGFNAPFTTSAGRLFDAVAALSGVATSNAFEGQAPMYLEAAIEPGPLDAYPASIADGNGVMMLDWSEALQALLDDANRGESPGAISRRFHNTLVNWIVDVARRAGLECVVLSGGCFQNAYLVERTSEALVNAGFQCFTHQRVPPNDGGIALGQAVIAGQQPPAAPFLRAPNER